MEKNYELEIKDLIENLNELTNIKNYPIEKMEDMFNEILNKIKSLENKINNINLIGGFKKIYTDIENTKNKAIEAKENTEELIDILSTIGLFIVPALHLLLFLF